MSKHRYLLIAKINKNILNIRDNDDNEPRFIGEYTDFFRPKGKNNDKKPAQERKSECFLLYKRKKKMIQ